MQHSVANPSDQAGDARLYAPAAARNRAPLVEALRPFLPQSGLALEIASGTGEHVVGFATAFPGLIWQPTDIDSERLASIAAWTRHEALGNIRPPLHHDAVAQRWTGPPANVVFLANLLHLVSQAEAASLIATMAGALAPSGTLALYGPFLREDGYASDGDMRFDAAIRAERPEAGYKSIGWTEGALAAQGLDRRDCVAMPANNLLLVWRRPP